MSRRTSSPSSSFSADTPTVADAAASGTGVSSGGTSSGDVAIDLSAAAAARTVPVHVVASSPPPNGLVLKLGLGVFVFFTACSMFEEYAFKGLGKFKYSWFFTFFELLCITAFAVADRMALDSTVPSAWHHRVALKEHAKVALYLLTARALTNKSLEFLNIPTQIIFKSMKLLPILLASTFILRRAHSRLEYVFAVMLALSATLFSLADLEAKAVAPVMAVAGAAAAPAVTTAAVAALTPAAGAGAGAAAAGGGGVFDANAETHIGIVIVLLSLVFDALQSTAQEYLLKDLKVTDPELLVWTNLFACAGMFVVSAATGELPGTAEYLQHYGLPALGCWIGRAVVTYFGIRCYVALMKAAGNVTANIIATVRKILTILISFVWFGKPFLPKYVLGLLVFAASFAVDYYDRQQKAAQRKAADAAATQQQPQPIALLPLPAATAPK